MKERMIRGAVFSAALAVVFCPVVGTVARAETTTLDVAADTQIREWVNYAPSNFGASIALGIGDYPSWQKQTWGLFRWDVSSIPTGETVNDVTFQIYQAYYTMPAADIEVYAIDEGDWEEGSNNGTQGGTGVTWSNWVGTETLVYLGDMEVIRGNCTFNDPDLTAWVRDWVDGDQENYGIVLQYHSVVGQEERPGWDNQYDEYFGNFYTKEYLEANPESGLIPPQLVIDYGGGPGPLQGDLNGDGFVGGDDLDIVRSFWGQTVELGNLLQGDPSEDGFVGGDDLDIVRGNWGQGTPPAPASVPEPATLAMLCGLGLLALKSRVRQQEV